MLNVSVISPEAVLFEGETDSVVAPAFDGEVGILDRPRADDDAARQGRAATRRRRAAASSTSRADFCRSSTTTCAS